MAIDFSQVTAITIPEGSVSQITDSSSNVLWSAGSNIPEWDPEMISLSNGQTITSTSAFNINAQNYRNQLIFIYPGQGYAVLYQNGTQLGSYYMGIGIYDCTKQRLWIINHGNNDGELSMNTPYDNITRVQLPGITSANQNAQGRHRLVYYYDRRQHYYLTNNFKVELIGGYCSTSAGTANKTINIHGTNPNTDYSIELIPGTTGSPWPQASLFILSNYNNATNAKYNTRIDSNLYVYSDIAGNWLTELWGLRYIQNDQTFWTTKGSMVKEGSSATIGYAGSISEQQLEQQLADITNHPIQTVTNINSYVSYQHPMVAFIKISLDAS